MNKLILTIMFVFMFASVSAAVFDHNVQAYWSFDETTGTVLEDIGNSGTNNGTVSNITDANWVSGLIANALNFSGSSQPFVSFSNDSSLYFTNQMSMSVWIKIKTPDSGSQQIFIKDPNGGTRDYKLQITGDVPVFCVNDGTFTCATSTFNVSDNAWHHIVAVNDGTDLLIYVDGALNKTEVGAGGAQTHNAFSPLMGTEINVAGNPTFTQGFHGLMDEFALFNKTLNSTDVVSLYNGGSGLPFADFVILRTPLSGSNIISDTIGFNATLNGGGLELANATLNIWRSNGTLFNQTTNTVTGTGANNTFFNVSGFTIGDYIWNVKGDKGNGLGTNSSFASSNFTFTYGVNITSTTNNATSFQTKAEQFSVNLTIPSAFAISTGYLFYNGTSYAATVTNSSITEYTLTRTIDIPGDSIGATSFNWNYTVGGVALASSAYTQTITKSIFILCNASITNTYLNLAFKNETLAEENTTATIASTWNYWLGSGTTYKTYSLTNATQNALYSFCFTPENKTINGNVSLLYDNSISEQRSWETTFSYTNTTSLQTLYLLPSAEGIFVTFQVINAAEQVISGVLANVTKSGTLIAVDTTNDAGTVTFFLDPDSSYEFTFAKTGYTTFQTTFTPTLTEYTVNLGLGTVSSSVFDFTQGMNWKITPAVGALLKNNTNQEFTFTLNSSFWTVDSFGFVLTNSSGIILNSTSAATNGGTLSVFIDTLNNTNIYMNYYWYIDGNYSNGTREWSIFDSTGTGFGLTTFASRVKTYVGHGLFGTNSFGLTIIAFFGVFLFTGIMSWKYGFTDPKVISAILLSLMLIVDGQLGLFPKQGLATAMVFVICAGVWIKEATK